MSKSSDRPDAATTYDGPLYLGAPFVPEVIAEDVVFAFKNGWFDLPRVVVTDEASERVTRLWEVKRWAERGARRESRGFAVGRSDHAPF